ncbi:MAG: DUF5103 domain-containing protein, partial [Sphingobacteriales bacterium]
YGKDATAKMVYNAEKQVYEGEMYLKQGYYDYVFGLYDPATRRFEMDATEGNVWETENTYLVLIYYRELGGRYDQLLGLQAVNSQFARPN